MRLEFSSNDSTTYLAESQRAESALCESGSAEVAEMLRDGIKAAQSGNRGAARQLLLRVTEADPKNENAWLWLASISEYPEELMVFLNNVLDINPENQRALEWAKATKSLLAKNFVQRGIEADRENRRDFARQCFMQAVVHDNRSEMAWLWLASIAETSEEKAAHLQRVLEINPNNETALASLKFAKDRSSAQAILSKANAAALAGDFDSAESLLEEALRKSPKLEPAWILQSHLSASFKQKAECFEKILEFNPESEMARLNLDFLRSMVETVETAEAEEQNPAETATEAEDNVKFTENSAEELYSLPADEPESEIVFAENQSEPEVFLMTDESFGETESNSFDFSDLEALRTDESGQNFAGEDFNFEAVENLPEAFAEENPFGGETALEDDCYEIDAGEVFGSGEIPENEFSAHTAQSEQNFAEAEENYSPQAEEEEESCVEPREEAACEQVEENFQNTPAAAAPAVCPFCEQENESRAFVCRVCNTMLTLSDLEMLLAHTEANRGIVQAAIEELEAEQNGRELECEELVNLGIGHINLKNLRSGLTALQKAVRLNPNNVVLESQVNALAIRLSEIEEKESVQNWMPRDKTIMVVDDSATVRKLISGKLEKCGHIVITAVDGMDAMEKLNDVTPDLILLDIAMPRMDGYQVCKLIRNNESTKEIPIVMISGKDGFFDKVRGRMAGTTSYITKPFGPETLMKMLETYLV
jgi:CheY-like chemotaxis protein